MATVTFSGTASDLGTDFTPVNAEKFDLESNNARVPLTGNPGSEYYVPLTPGEAQYSQVTLVGTDLDTASTFGVGPCVRMATGADTSYWCACNTVDEYELYELSAGTLTSLGSYTAGAVPGTGDQPRLDASGSSLEVFVNTVSRITATDSTLATGRIGIRGEAEMSYSRLSAWEGDDLLDPTAAVTGTATASITEADIVAGGKTIITTLTDATWVPNTIVPPTLDTGESTQSGNNTASASWAVSYPNAATGDLLVFGISWDDSTTTTDVSEPAGPNGETLSEVNATPAVASNTASRCKVWYTIATGAWTASTLTFTPSATEQWTGACVVIPAGEFDGTTPIGASTTDASAGVTETAVLSAAFSAGATDGDGRLFCWTAVNQDPQTLAADWTQIANTDRGIVSGALFSRDAAVTDSESIASDTVATIVGDDWCSVSFIVRAPATTPFEAARQAIIDGLDSAQSETTGWNNEVRDNLAVSTVARTSDTVVTVTLSAQAAYNITANETITVTVPATALASGGPLTATPTFGIAFAAGATTHNAAVSFAGAGSASFAATVQRQAAVSYAGAGSTAFAATVKRAAAVSFAGAGSFSAAAGRVLNAAVSFAGAGTLDASASVQRAAAVAFTGAGSFAAAGTVITGPVTHAAAVSFLGAGSFAAAAIQTHTAAVSFAGAGSATFAATQIHAAVASWTGTGAFATQARTVRNAAVAFAGAGSFTTTATQTHAARVTFSGAGSFSTAGNIVTPGIHHAEVSFAGTGSFGTAATQIHRAAVSFSGAGSFAAVASALRPAAVAFAGAGSFAAGASIAKSASVSFAGAGEFAALAFVLRSASVSFAGAGFFDALAFENAIDPRDIVVVPARSRLVLVHGPATVNTASPTVRAGTDAVVPWRDSDSEVPSRGRLVEVS